MHRIMLSGGQPVGAVEQEVYRVGRRYAAVLRAAVVTCTSLVALGQVPQERFVPVAGLVAVLLGWQIVFVARVSRRWVLPVDLAVLVAVCLTQPWTVPADAVGNSTNWVAAVVSVTVVAHQWHTDLARGAAVAVVAVLAYLTGASLAAPDDWATWLPFGLWTFAEAGMSRTLFLLVRAGARATDRDAERAELARRDAEVAAALRADEREHFAALHDTAAATLLATGLGVVGSTEPWLVEQAKHDLAVLTAWAGTAEGDADLVPLLSDVVRHSPVRVALRSPDEVVLPAVPAVALSRAVREALTNVSRHAGVDEASLVVARQDGGITVEVADRGQGFDPADVPPQRRGLSVSIAERMARAGGRATVEARPGGGTRVCLVWPHG